jgi:hypothetical protein
MVAPVFQQENTTLELLAAYGHFPVTEQPYRPKDAYLFLCPFHADTHPSLAVHSDGQRWKCWAGCGQGGPATMREMLGGGTVPRMPNAASTPKKTPKKAAEPLQGCTMVQLADARGLPTAYLLSLGWRDATYAKVPAVAVPWPGGTHYRVNLDGKPKYKWQQGAQVSILGIQRLEEVRRLGWVLFVEGETDYAAGLLLGLPVMAIPGASTFKKEWALQFQGCQVYAWQEPGQGGKTMVDRLGEAFWDINIIAPPPGSKDLCELLDQSGGDGARDCFNGLKAAARRWRPSHLPATPKPANPNLLQYQNTQRSKTHEAHTSALTPPLPRMDTKPVLSGVEGVKPESWNDGSFRFPCNKFGSVLNLYLGQQKDKLLEQLKEQGEGKLYEWVAHCYEFYKEWECQTTNRKFLRRVHCGERGCSLCAVWRLEQFFADKQAVLEQLARPAVYRVILGTRSIGATPEEKARQIKKIYAQVRGMVTHLTDNGVLKDLSYGIRAHIQGEAMSIELDLLTEYGLTLEGELKEHFGGETGVTAYVERIPCADRREAQRAMSRLMAVPLVWDSLGNYAAWRAATKSMKLIQGKGKFYKVAGGGGKKQPAAAAHTSSCPVCRTCQPVASNEFYPVATTEVRQVVSEITGEPFLQRVKPGG